MPTLRDHPFPTSYQLASSHPQPLPFQVATAQSQLQDHFSPENGQQNGSTAWGGPDNFVAFEPAMPVADAPFQRGYCFQPGFDSHQQYQHFYLQASQINCVEDNSSPAQIQNEARAMANDNRPAPVVAATWPQEKQHLPQAITASPSGRSNLAGQVPSRAVRHPRSFSSPPSQSMMVMWRCENRKVDRGGQQQPSSCQTKDSKNRQALADPTMVSNTGAGISKRTHRRWPRWRVSNQVFTIRPREDSVQLPSIREIFPDILASH